MDICLLCKYDGLLGFVIYMGRSYGQISGLVTFVMYLILFVLERHYDQISELVASVMYLILPS